RDGLRLVLRADPPGDRAGERNPDPSRAGDPDREGRGGRLARSRGAGGDARSVEGGLQTQGQKERGRVEDREGRRGQMTLQALRIFSSFSSLAADISHIGSRISPLYIPI